MITISHHAYHRAKERLGYNPDAFKRLAAQAYCYGISQAEAKGKLRRFIESRCAEHPGNKPRIYGENIYIFKENCLVTVYQLPADVRASMHKINNNNAKI